MKQRIWMLAMTGFLILLCSACIGKSKNEESTTATVTAETSISRRDDSQTRAEPYPTVKIPTSPDDPYAQIIKTRYETIAQNVAAEYFYEGVKYALYDIDGDGVQELLLSKWYSKWGYAYESEYDSDEIGKEGIIFDRFYYISNGKAVEMPVLNGLWYDAAGPTGGRDILSNGVIRLYGGTPNYTSYAYFRYSNGELEFINALMHYKSTGYFLDSENRSTPITEEEFNRMRAEIEGDAQVVEIDWKPLESYGRE